ncbi:zinc knuckle CX2CX4HX4C containing protein [Tanacetum coccineum]
MDYQSNASKMREKTAGNLGASASGVSCDGSPKANNSSPLISCNVTINMPRGLYNVVVAATFGVSLTTVGDLDVLIKDIEASEDDELLSGMTNDKRMVVMDALGVICDSIKAGNSIPGASAKDQPKGNSNFRPLVADLVFDGVNIFIPRKVVEMEQLGETWGGPWMIRNSLIILKKWSMETRLLKEELTRIPIWVKLHDVPIQVFEEGGISLIATFIGKPFMLDSYTSSMSNDLWGRSSFARCLIKVNSEADLVDAVTIGIPSLTGDDFTKETIHVEYEWKPPRCDLCKIFGHVHDHCPKKVKKRKGKSNSINGGQLAGPSVKQPFRYEPTTTTGAPKKGAINVGNASKSSSMLKTAGTSSKKDNITMSNSYSALNDEEEDEEEDVENVYDESANLFPKTKIGGSSSSTAACSVESFVLVAISCL